MLTKGYQWVYFAFYIDMVVMLLVGIFRSRLPQPINEKGLIKEYRYSKILGFAFFLPITIIAACRTSFIDTGDYILMYNYTAPDFSTVHDGKVGNIETGFIYFMAILNRITSDPQILFIISSIVINACFIKFIYNNCIDVPFGLMIFLCQIWTDSMNGLRQFIVAGIVCLAWESWAKKERTIKNDLALIAIVLLCMQFHKSVLICAVIFLITRGKLFNIGTIASIVGTIALYAIPSVYRFLFETVFASDSYSEYETTNSGMSVMRLLVCAVPLIFIILQYYVNRDDAENPHDITNWMMNIAIFSFCCSVLAMKMVYFARLTIYLNLFNIVLIPNLIHKTIKGNMKVVIKIAAFFLYVVYFFYQMDAYGGYMSKQFNLMFLD